MIRVLVVDDEAITARAHARYVEQLDGFEVAIVASTAGQALAALGAAKSGERAGIDLVLLDMNLPDAHGLDLCRRMRAVGIATDVIAISAVRDPQVVRASVAAGIVQYLIKPFGFETFRDRLQRYRRFALQLDGAGEVTSQQAVDQAFGALRQTNQPGLSKGLSPETLEAVEGHLRRADAATAQEVADVLEVARVTARRYLERLVDTGHATRAPRYGTPGRPQLEYRMIMDA